ncbi:kinase-like protein [Phaeosphaeriaceae sp. SRC1lsM3a]|nr:kinase-like protein [Stagonospora sp. SRC1lsM3a]
METEVLPLTAARRAAESFQLGPLLDAYETFCAYGCMPEAWKVLALQLSIYLESDDIANLKNAAQSPFRSNEPFRSYLRKVESHFGWEMIGYLVSDFVVALFHATSVLPGTHHFERDAKTLAFDVVPWDTDTVPVGQRLTRQHLGRLLPAEIYQPLADIATHLLRDDKGAARQSNDSWTPCGYSYAGILPFLTDDYEMDWIPDFQRRYGSLLLVQIEPPKIEPPKRSSTLLRRAAARAAGLLGTPDRPQDQAADGSLVSIQEDATIDFHTFLPKDSNRRSLRNSKRSSYSDYRSFITALTHRTVSSKGTSFLATESRQSLLTNDSNNKRSTMQTFLSWPTSGTQIEDMVKVNKWASVLKQRDIIPDPELENWSSGRGQHAEYLSDERTLIPLTVESKLGQTSNALVESVRCMRVLLVRKVIRCNKRTKLKREDALQEVQQLYRAQHSHVVRLVGTYIIDDELAILTYPCADWNLEQFLATAPSPQFFVERTQAITKFFTCLVKALDFLHSFPIKHMDIKPQNILVRNIRHSNINGSDPFKIYFTDFGSSRLYPSIEDSETDNWTPFTRTYAAQEVVLQERRGLSADIYSMGCVFAEMLATALDGSTHAKIEEGESTFFQHLLQIRSGSDGRPKPYYSKLDSICDWLKSLAIHEPELSAVRDWTVDMLHKDQERRPTARQIADDPHLPPPCLSCMTRPGPEAFEAQTQPGPRDSMLLYQRPG